MGEHEIQETARGPCEICGEATKHVGERTSQWSGLVFGLSQCPHCYFSFVSNARTDFDVLYSDDYYHGKGADPLVEYAIDVAHPDTSTQRFAWKGIRSLVNGIIPITESTAWLDYGCGAGGLVQYLRRNGVPATLGFEQGAAVSLLRKQGVPYVAKEELSDLAGRFDVVTAIEVLEHMLNPLQELRTMRSLLRPGGVLFLTTGNARPFRRHIDRWQYVNPDVHVSFFEPETLELAFRKVGLQPQRLGYRPGWTLIYRSKLLHTLKIHRSSQLHSLVPWGVLGRALDARLRLADQPIGRA